MKIVAPHFSILALMAIVADPAGAQLITGTPGSPSATVTIEGNQIPAPDPKFGGVIKELSTDSKTWWPPRIVGDQQMLEWTAAGSGAHFMGIVHHTDVEREWAYDRESHVGKLDKALDEATAKGWTVVDMKNDWKVIYPFEKK
jgi:hypothetical protein